MTADPLFDATDPTNGGGDTGSVLISPYIKPGTVSTTDYNHYSWLRTMEDMFDVSSCAGTPTDVTLPAGSVCGGLDGQGHIGYAAQAGLTPFGADVFTAPSGNGFCLRSPTTRGGAPRVAAGRGLPSHRHPDHGRVPGGPSAEERGHHGMTTAVAPVAELRRTGPHGPVRRAFAGLVFWVVFFALVGTWCGASTGSWPSRC